MPMMEVSINGDVEVRPAVYAAASATQSSVKSTYELLVLSAMKGSAETGWTTPLQIECTFTMHQMQLHGRRNRPLSMTLNLMPCCINKAFDLSVDVRPQLIIPLNGISQPMSKGLL